MPDELPRPTAAARSPTTPHLRRVLVPRYPLPDWVLRLIQSWLFRFAVTFVLVDAITVVLFAAWRPLTITIWGRGLLTISLIGLGWTLFQFRKHYRRQYGITEMAVAAVALFEILGHEPQDPLAYVVGLLGGVYIVVRGLDNFHHKSDAEPDYLPALTARPPDPLPELRTAVVELPSELISDYYGLADSTLNVAVRTAMARRLLPELERQVADVGARLANPTCHKGADLQRLQLRSDMLQTLVKTAKFYVAQLLKEAGVEAPPEPAASSTGQQP